MSKMNYREYGYFKYMTADEYFIEYGRGSPTGWEVFIAWIKYDILHLHKLGFK